MPLLHPESLNPMSFQAAPGSTPSSQYFQSEPLARRTVVLGRLVTMMLAVFVALTPRSSEAIALMVWLPAVISHQANVNGEVLSSQRVTPSTRNSTLVTVPSSVATAV